MKSQEDIRKSVGPAPSEIDVCSLLVFPLRHFALYRLPQAHLEALGRLSTGACWSRWHARECSDGFG